jgi:folate-binding protein YgfZ
MAGEYARPLRLGNRARAHYFNAMPIAHLADRAVLAVSGPEARGFLQGLVTNDMELGGARYAALLTPQGKILFDFIVVERSGVLLIDCAKPMREALQKRLSLYRLRAKVEIAPRDDLSVMAAWDSSELADSFADPRMPELGIRAITTAAQDDADYLSHRLALGVPEGADFGQDKMFALDAGLDELNAVSFTKGCYVGQELTARMKHRGTARKRLLLVESLDGSALVPDAAIAAETREIGTITSVYGARGFGLIRLDRLAEAGTVPLEANGIPVRVTKQSWLTA